MSWILQREITKITRDFISPIEKEIFKASANYGQDDGTRIFPSLETLEKDTGRCRRTVQSARNSLVKKNLLILVKAATPRSTPEYAINVDRIKNIVMGRLGDTSENDVKSSNSGVQQLHPWGAAVTPLGCSGYTQSLIEPLKESLKINTSYFQKNFSFNGFNLKTFSYEPKPMSVKTEFAYRKKIILDRALTLEKEQPTPNSEQSIHEEKAVGTSPTLPLQPKPVEAPKESKATKNKKAPQAKPTKVIKTRINRNLELTPERRQIGLNARFLNRGLVEGVIETEFESFVDYHLEKGTLRSDWNLSWKGWCKMAIELDKYHRKTIENPIRSGTTVSAATEEKVSIDSAFTGFVKEKLKGMQFDFEGATYAEIDDRIVIDQHNSFRRDQLEKLKDRLQKYFGKEIELKWLRNSWVVPTVSNHETEIVTAEMKETVASKIVTSDIWVPSPVPVPSPISSSFCVEEIPLETSPVDIPVSLSAPSSDYVEKVSLEKSSVDVSVSSPVSLLICSPVFTPLCVGKIPLAIPPARRAKTLLQEPSDRSEIDKTLESLFKAMQERSGTRSDYKINWDNSFSCEQNNPLIEEENDLKTAENASDETQFHPAEQSLAQKSVMIFSPVEADLAVDQLQPNKDVQENRSEISITQTCLELPNEISAKPVEEEIRLEVREEINNIPHPRTSSTTSAISNSPIKLNKPKSALHLPKFAVTAAKSFSDFPSTAKKMLDYAEMIKAGIINAKLRKEMPPGLSKTAQESLIEEQCDIITAEVVNAAQVFKDNQFGLR